MRDWQKVALGCGAATIPGLMGSFLGILTSRETILNWLHPHPTLPASRGPSHVGFHTFLVRKRNGDMIRVGMYYPISKVASWDG